MTAPVPTTTVLIFGASGDLTRRKLVPALFHLHRTDRLPQGLHVVGTARSPMTDDEFRARMRSGVEDFLGPVNTEAWAAFGAKLSYVAGDLREAEDYAALEAGLRAGEEGAARRLYHLATPPRFFARIVEGLGQAGMSHGPGWRRVVVEKPFGRDLASARALNAVLHKSFSEDQIYRIDHYLGKETAQNLLFFRFANTIFEPVWNRNYVDHVQITVAESIDVGHRAAYYDHAGVARDMFQNHLLQLMSLVAMEPPNSFEADAIRNEKTKLLGAVRPLGPDELPDATVRGQYAGYLEAEGVAGGSTTATFAALRLDVDNWRWQGVPFYLRSGKALADKTSEIVVRFKCPPHLMFPLPRGQFLQSNYLALCIQPHEGMHLRFEVKVPDTLRETRSVDMEFHYDEAFGSGAIHDAYVRLLLDALTGDASLFTRSDGIERSWEIIEPVIDGWEAGAGPPLESYDVGSWGPPGADALLARDGRRWHRGCREHD
ncbi:MAG: glucose-6-phosphate dehydrogenase [Anaerolineae bacterium]